jgi:hypothetical protein
MQGEKILFDILGLCSHGCCSKPARAARDIRASSDRSPKMWRGNSGVVLA